MNIAAVPSSEVSLARAIGDASVVAFNVGPGGEAWLVLALRPLDDRTQDNGFAIFPKTMPDVPQRYRVVCVRSGLVELDVAIDGEPFNLHEVQPVGDLILLACSRCQYRGPDDFDLNGRLYSRDGRFVRGMLLGDGIETLQATRSGEVWAAYFDEGVFGNFGWQRPIGAPGLIAWGAAGEKLYEYEAGGGAGPIDDCYALNVSSDDEAWCCYYSNFPLVRLHQKRIASLWEIPVSGSHAFAVGDGHALFAGGYKARDAYHLLRLGSNGKAEEIGRFELRDAQGAAVTAERVVGRGRSLHVLSGTTLHEIDIRTVLASPSFGRR